MHDKFRNSENSDLRRHHIRQTEHHITGGGLIKINIKKSNKYLAHHAPYGTGCPSHIPPEMIPGAKLNKDPFADERSQYLLPEPDHMPERGPVSNIDCCCQDFGVGSNNYLESLAYQSSPSELSRQRWDRDGWYYPELF